MRYVPGFALIGVLVLFSDHALSQNAASELMDLENAWAAAVVKADKSFLERLYADEYHFTAPDGSTGNRQTDIADVASGKFKIRSADLTDMTVRFYGDVAVVTGLNTLKGSYGDEDMSGAYRFTDVFVKRDGRWQVVATQATQIAGK